MKRKTLITTKSPLTFGLIAGILLMMMHCDKFTDVEFLTKNNFSWDSSSHEFIVETKDETSISSISINGKRGVVASPNKLTKDTIIHFDGYSVLYSKDLVTNSSQDRKSSPDEHFGPTQIIGEWFTIKKSYPSSLITHIFIDENNEDSERNLIINIDHEMTRGEITVIQKERR